jgi:hypothetical protein
LKMRETLSGKESFETLNSINLLGVVLDDQGKYDEALVMHRRGSSRF